MSWDLLRCLVDCKRTTRSKALGLGLQLSAHEARGQLAHPAITYITWSDNPSPSRRVLAGVGSNAGELGVGQVTAKRLRFALRRVVHRGLHSAGATTIKKNIFLSISYKAAQDPETFQGASRHSRQGIREESSTKQLQLCQSTDAAAHSTNLVG